jgi:hypothetical protein
MWIACELTPRGSGRNGRKTLLKPQAGARRIGTAHKVMGRVRSGRPVDENA